MRLFIKLVILLSLFVVACGAQTGTGLTGKYYDTDTFGTLKTTRTDATINFNWGSSIPSGTALTSGDTFSVIWTGQIEAEYNEVYTFHLAADNYARLWIDDQYIVGRSYYQNGAAMRGRIRLKAGHKVNIRVEYAEVTGSAAAKLEWESDSQARQVVPSNRLYTTTEIPNGGALMREVWTGIPGTDIASITSHPNYPYKPASREFLTSFECLAQNWEDDFGTRVTGFIRPPATGTYTFAVSGDEVVQLSLSTDATSANKVLIASTATATPFRNWTTHATQQSASITLVAGRVYYVELFHKESTGADHWSVAWKKPGDASFSVIPGSALMQPGTELPTPSTSNWLNTLATEQPRLGATRERFLWLKQQYQSPVASQAKSRAQWVVSTANTDVANSVEHYGNEYYRMATAWWLTGDSKYPEKVWSKMATTIANGTNAGFTDKWKGTTLRDFAVAYDWLYPYWDETRRTALLNFLINSGLNSQANAYSNNIGILNDSGFIMTTLAVGLGNESKAESNLNKAVSQLLQKINQWEPNAGVWLEGTDYGIFAKNGLAPAMHAMETALGSTFSVGRMPGFFTARREPLTIASNTRQRFTFSDVGTASNNTMGWGNWWGRRYNAPEVYDFSRLAGNSTWNALLLPETTISPAQADMNPDTAFVGPTDSVRQLFQNVATFRENWTDSKATFVGGMGGTFMSHGMLQSGTFQLSARGVNWFVDLKSGSYDVPGYNTTTPNPNGADRWDYYRNRAEGHNCLIVNPTNMPDRIWNAPSAPLIAFQSAPKGQRSFAVWDLTNNITGVTKVQRGIQLFNQRKHVLVQDEIVNPTPATCWWFAHFPSSFSTTISADRSSVILQSGGERLWGKIVSGDGLWTNRTAQPLPASPAPAENGSNSGFRKLAIELTGVTNTTLAVWFVPLAPGEEPPVTTPLITPLNTWNLTEDQNEAPVAKIGSAESAGGAPVDVDLRAHVTDDWTPAGQLAFSLGTAVGGSVALQPDGFTARFAPTPGFIGLQSFSFSATDGDGATGNTGTIAFSVPAVVTNWTSAASGNWSTAANWQNATAPVSSPGNDLRFFSGQSLGATTVTATNNLAGTTELNRLELAGTGTATTVVNLAGSPLSLVKNGITAPRVQLSASTTGFRYNVGTPIILDQTTRFDAAGSATFVFNGVLSGSGGLTRTGTSSTLILAGNNTYAGPTTISAGTLQFGNDGSTGLPGSGPIDIASDATLRFDRTGSVAISNDITGAGRILINGTSSSDVASLTGDNDFTGEVRVDNGSLRVSDAKQLGTGTKKIVVASTAALLRLDGSAAPVVLPPEFSVFTSNPNGAILNEAGDNEIAGKLTISSGAGNTRLTVAAGSLTLGGTVTTDFTGRALDLRGAGTGIINGDFIDGTGANTIAGFSKNDAGTWILNGDNSISCTTVVSAGKLVINGSHASGNVSVSSGATLAGTGSLTAPTTITGTLAPGNPVGPMNFASTLSFGSASKLRCGIGSNSLVASQALAAGIISVTSGAKIDVALNTPGSTANYTLSFWRNSRTWPVATGAALSGTFQLGTVTTDSVGNPTSTYGAFSLQHTATSVHLVWTPVPGFPIIDEPLVTFLQPSGNPALLPNVESTVRLSALAAGGGPITYVWTTLPAEENSEGTATIANPASAETTVTFSEPGPYLLRCTADNGFVSRSADLLINVGASASLSSLPAIDPGILTEAGVSFPHLLDASVGYATSSILSLVSGPGTATFANPATPGTSVTFSATGDYTLRLTATNDHGEAYRDFVVSVASTTPGFAAWQAAHWPGITDLAIIGPDADPDGDGVKNSIEFQAGTDPTSSASVPPFVWTRTDNGNWSSAASWKYGVAPASNALAEIEFFTDLSPGGTFVANNDIGSSFTLKNLILNGGGNASPNLTGVALTFANGGGIVANGSGPSYTISSPITLGTSLILSGSTGDLLQVNGVLSGSGTLTKRDAFTTRFGANNTMTGGLLLDGGELAYQADQSTALSSITFGPTNGSTTPSTLTTANLTANALTVRTSTAEANRINVTTGKTLTISGGIDVSTTDNYLTHGAALVFNPAGPLASSTFRVTGSGSIVIGKNNAAQSTTRTTLLDARNLSVFNVGTSTTPLSAFQVGFYTAQAGNYEDYGINTAYLAPATTIYATTFGVGDMSGGVGGQTQATLFLGSGANRIHATTITIGEAQDLNSNGAGRLRWNTGVTTGSLALAGTGSAPAVTNMYVGSKIDTGSTYHHTGTADFSNGIVTGGITNLYVGYQTANGGADSPKTYGTFRLGSGANDLTVSNLYLGYQSTNSSTYTTSGIFEMSGGSVAVANNIEMTRTAGGISSLSLLGGNLTVGGDITGGGGSSTLTINGGTLDMGGGMIGTAAKPIGTLTFTSGTLKNVGGVNGSAQLVKTGTGTMTLDGSNTLTGNVSVSAGGIVLPQDAEIRFSIQPTTSNKLTGAGSATIHGTFFLDLTNPEPTFGKSWILVDIASRTYGPSFAVKSTAGDFVNNGATWELTQVVGGTSLDWSFSPTTGILSVSVGNPGTTNANWTSTTSGVWKNGANWAGGLSPTGSPSTVVAFFDGLSVPSATLTATNDFTGTMQMNALKLGGTGTATTTVSVGGNALQLVANGTTNPVVQLDAASSTFTITNPVTLDAATTFTGAGNGTFIFAGPISGPGLTLTKNSTGTLTFTGANTYAGSTSVLRGTLTLGSGGSIAPTTGAALTLGSNTSSNGPATFNYSSAETSHFGAIIVGNGNDGVGNTILNQSAGTILGTALTLNNGFTGQGAGDVNLTGGTLAISGATTVSNTTFSDNVWSSITVDAGAAFSTDTLNLTGAPAATRFAAGRLTQNGGNVTVAGTLNLARATATNTAARRGEYHLNGGILIVNAITQDTGADTFGTVTFNGGTLTAGSPNATFWPANAQTTAQINNGGAKIDTAGFDITVTQPLVNFAGATTASLAKQGLGTLTLAGANTYTGDTTVEAGTLAITGSLANSAVQILDGATLAGTGSLGGGVTVRSGGRQAFAIAASAGAQTVRPIAGALVLEAGNIIDLSAAVPPAPGTYVLATAAGGITGAPGVVNLNGIPGNVAVIGNNLQITVTGNNLQLTVTAPATGFTAWLSLYPELTDATADGDPDGDGITNLLEYVLNGNPAVQDPDRLPTLTVAAGNYVFTFSRRAESATDTVQTFEYSLDLTTWFPLSVTEPSAAQVSLGEVNAGIQTVTISLPESIAVNGRFFARLRATSTP